MKSRDSLVELETCSSGETAIPEDCKVGRKQINCCTYCSRDGNCDWTDWNNDETASVLQDWHGREGLTESGTIGLLLDLDEGTLSVCKNGRRLGAMKNFTVYSPCTISMSKDKLN